MVVGALLCVSVASVQAAAIPVSEDAREQRNTFYYALERKDNDAMKQMITAGFDVKAYDEHMIKGNNYSSLAYASALRNYSAVPMLIKAGAIVDAPMQGFHDRSVMHSLIDRLFHTDAQVSEIKAAVVQLLEAGANPYGTVPKYTILDTVLSRAYETKKAEHALWAIEQLIAHAKDTAALVNERRVCGDGTSLEQPPVMRAMSLIKRVSTQTVIDEAQKLRDHEACVAIVQRLVAAGADMTARYFPKGCPEGRTVIYYAQRDLIIIPQEEIKQGLKAYAATRRMPAVTAWVAARVRPSSSGAAGCLASRTAIANSSVASAAAAAGAGAAH